MTAQELAQKIIDIAEKALEQEKHMVIYIGDTCEAREGLEAIIKLCQDVPPAPPVQGARQDGFKQYEKKEVSHAKTGEKR
jgi:hypothetical protein